MRTESRPAARVLAAVYLPALMLVRRLCGGYSPVVPFPLAAALLGVLPTALIAIRWGGGVSAVATPEAALFLGLFTAVGIVFGLGYAVGRPPV